MLLIPYRNIAIAIWLITQGLGTLFNAGIAFLPISLLVSFFFYVGLIVLLTIIFVLLNRNYKYREDVLVWSHIQLIIYCYSNSTLVTCWHVLFKFQSHVCVCVCVCYNNIMLSQVNKCILVTIITLCQIARYFTISDLWYSSG